MALWAVLGVVAEHLVFAELLSLGAGALLGAVALRLKPARRLAMGWSAAWAFEFGMILVLLVCGRKV